jgi:hypothetical protein
VNLSRTWNARLHRWRNRSRSVGAALVCVAAAFGAAAGGKVFLAPDRPDIGAISQRVGNQSDQVGAFTADFVVSWLTATTAQRTALHRFITIADDALTPPSTPAAVVTAPQVVSVIRTGTIGDADLYAATVSINERPYASAEPTRAFYRVPVAMWNYQPRALTLPARVNGPGPGADFPITYRHVLSSDSPIYAVVSGFLHAYLTTAGGLDRYVLAGTPLAAVGGYQSAVIASAATDRPVPADAEAGTQVHVLATVHTQTSQFATVTLVYPLTVENSGGTWMLAAIDLMPQIDDDTEATPVTATPH